MDSVGCRLNISEIEAIARQLAAAGHRVVGPGDDADLCIFNTCTVTAVASRKSRRFIRQLRRRHPSAAIVVTGCHAELSPDEVLSLGVDRVIGNHNKERIPEILEEEGLLGDSGEGSGEVPCPVLAPGSTVHTRAFLKVQDGCDNRCAFCVVTLARGPGRSLAPDEVIRQVDLLLRHGHAEVVLSGVHLGSYCHDVGDRGGLLRLVHRILEETDVTRLRLSSLEPWDLDADFFELFTDGRLMPHLHLPLQSGCDATLRRMARKTTTADYAALLEAARRRITDVSISTDVMVGFPGESDADFDRSLAFVEEMAFSRLHVFRYSRREGTPAAELPDPVRGPAMQERSRRMHLLGAQLEESFNRRFIGRTLPVLWEESEHGSTGKRWNGLTPNYIRVVAEVPEGVDICNKVTPVRLERLVPGAIEGGFPGGTLPLI